MKLTYGQLESVLALHLQIHPDKVPTFRSRLKQLQRLEFPPGVNVGRGLKMEYTSEHLFMLATVFEIIGLGLPAQAACKMVIDHWSHFSGGFALAALQERAFNLDRPDQVLAVVHLHSLHEIQFSSTRGRISHSEVTICDASAVASEFVTHDYDRNYSRIVVSIGRLLTRLLAIARDNAGVVSAGIYDADFHAWLPGEKAQGYRFKTRYPDRSNLSIRKELHALYGNDPDSLTPDGLEEAQQFIADSFSPEVPF